MMSVVLICCYCSCEYNSSSDSSHSGALGRLGFRVELLWLNGSLAQVFRFQEFKAVRV